MAKPYQVAAIPFRRGAANQMEVLLVTSRETRRWVVPKGWPWRKVENHDSAAGEAWEEAGVRGKPQPEVFGTFTYDKRRNGKVRPLQVRVYLLEVDEEAPSWPEQEERLRRWFGPAEAADLVAEPELKALLLELAAA